MHNTTYAIRLTCGWALLSLFLLLLNGCKEKSSAKKVEIITWQQAPPFNADSAYGYIQTQVQFGPRIPNSIAHKKCEEYLITSLSRHGWQVVTQPFEVKAFDNKILKATNIIASFNPDATKRILLAAHWDTRPFADQDSVNKNKPIDGANDGASGVGVLLEIARTITASAEKPKIGIDIILFDAEDYGQPENSGYVPMQDSYCLGSQYWAKTPHKPLYKAYYGILLDMVGAKNAVFAMEGTSMMYAAEVMKKVWNIAAQLGYGSVFIPQTTDPIIDDHYYINKIAKIPTIDIIEYNPQREEAYFGYYWHTHNDNISIIDKNTLKAVGQVVLQTLYNESISTHP